MPLKLEVVILQKTLLGEQKNDRNCEKIFGKLHNPGGSDGKESACNTGDLGFNPWVGKITWRREWQPTPVFLPGEFHGQRSLTEESGELQSVGSQRVRNK